MPAGNLLVIQGGGPTAVVNCSLAGILEEFKNIDLKKSKVLGALHSIDGIINEDLIDLGRIRSSAVNTLRNSPGAALGSCRRKMNEEDYGHIINVFEKYDIHYFLCIGGNGSMYIAHRVSQQAKEANYDLTVLGIPKTIDNDLDYTDHSPGFGSAARYMAATTRMIGVDVKSLPPPISIIESPGRNTGWLAASSALAKEEDFDAPNLIYFPETPFNLNSFLSDVENVFRKIKRATIVVSEGLKDEFGNYLGGTQSEASKDGVGRDLPGGAASYLAEKVSQVLKIRARSEKPGLAVRSAIEYVSKVDQEEAFLLGKKAVDLVLKGEGDIMTVLKRLDSKKYKCSIGSISLDKVSARERALPAGYRNESSNFVSQAFLEYCMPLIGGPLTSFPSIQKHKIVINNHYA
jgi:ATP-dependent phosphofructokinase / diphosphate-dependent phosphofructokinase